MYDKIPDRYLWQAVLVRAMLDALSPGANYLDRDRARDWLTKPNRDFDKVCNLAGFDPSFIRRSFKSGRITYANLSGNYQHGVAA